MDEPPNLGFTDPMIGANRRLRGLLPRPALRVFLALLVVDVVFLVLHASRVRYDRPGSDMWLISRDRGFPEIWQYGKEAVIVVMLMICHRRVRSPVHLVWATTFTYFLVDDSLEVHETLGDVIASGLALNEPFGIEGRDAGQVLVSGSVGLLLIALVVGATLTDRGPARRLTGRLLPVLGAIGFFGVVADVIDVIDVLGLVEDGGEMAAMTAAVAIVADHWRAGAPTGTRTAFDGSVSATPASVTGDSAQPIESVDPTTS